MKIALLSFEYPPETGFGGIGTYTWYQARGLAKIGHEVHVLAGATEPTELRTTEHDGVQVHRYRSDGRLMRMFRQFGKRELWWTQNRLENALSMKRGLAELLKTHSFDAVEMPECGAEGAILNHLTHKKTVVKFHSPAALIMSCYDVKPADIKYCSFVERRGINGAGAFTSCSQFLADEVRTKMGVKRPIRVIPNGIDVDMFDASEQVNAREKFGIPKDRMMIFFAGRMEPRKGIHLCKDIVEAIATKYEVAFVFAGQDLFNYMKDTLLPHMESLNLKGSVHYVGKLDLTDVGSCLRQTDIFLIPSTWENCPYSCLEAMAAGRAIMSSDAGGLPELIRDGETGVLAKSEESAGFIEGLTRLIEDPDFRHKLGSNARQAIEDSYTDVHIAKVTADYYRECYHGGPAPRD